MVVTVRSLGLNGIAGYAVSAECFLSGGLPAFDIVGLPDAAVRSCFLNLIFFPLNPKILLNFCRSQSL